MIEVPGLDAKAIGERIKKRREELRLTQGELADRAGLHLQSISNYENGRIPKTKELTRLAGALGLTVSEVLTGNPVADLDRGRGHYIKRRLGPRPRTQETFGPPEVEVLIDILSREPELVPWIYGLIRILRSGSADSILGIEVNVNAFLGDLGLEKVPRSPTRLSRRAKPAG